MHMCAQIARRRRRRVASHVRSWRPSIGLENRAEARAALVRIRNEHDEGYRVPIMVVVVVFVEHAVDVDDDAQYGYRSVLRTTSKRGMSALV